MKEFRFAYGKLLATLTTNAILQREIQIDFDFSVALLKNELAINQDTQQRGRRPRHCDRIFN